MKRLPVYAVLKGAHKLAGFHNSGEAMLRKIASLVIASLLCNVFTVYAQSQSAQEIKFKRQVVERGTNQKVKVKLKSNETLQGNIAAIRNDSFTLQFVDQTGQVISREIAYSDLSKVSKTGGSKAGSTLKQGALYGAGIYIGMALASLVVIGIASAISR
jgi:hypothetical protein